MSLPETFNFLSTQDAAPMTKHTIATDDIRRVNPALARYYEEHLLPARTAVVGLVVSNTSKRVSKKGSYQLGVGVRPVDEAHLALIQNVVFAIHPAMIELPSVDVTQPPFVMQQKLQKGQKTCKVTITLFDIHGFAHRLSYRMSAKKNEEHQQTITIQLTSPNSNSNSNSNALPVMTGIPESEMHGAVGVGRGWAPPRIVTFCDEEARPGYSTVKAHEYNEHPMTLREKVKVLADLIRQSHHFVAYTGAGISTASGIDDYASKSKDSVATGKNATSRPAKKRGLDAEPTYAHYVMAALSRAGHLKHWIQQNHDGLPQKAGYPQHTLNEIHGAWFDPSNPVVPMSGSLRSDLCAWLREEEQKADLVIAMGTSLCGMNADRVVSTSGKKFLRESIGLGSVIIGFQQTRLDHLASLRIFANIDEVMLLLALEMQLNVPTEFYQFHPNQIQKQQQHQGAVKPHQYMVPYDHNGERTTDTHTLWDLSLGAKVKLTAGPGKGFEGVIVNTPRDALDHYTVKLPCTREGKGLGKGEGRYCFGSWWVEECVNGHVPLLPLVNVNPVAG